MEFSTAPTERSDAAARSEDKPNWVEGHILNPFVNAIGIEPYNAVANAVNFVSQNELLGKKERLQVAQTEFLTPGWFTQSLFGGLGSAAPYAIAGFGAGRVMRGTGARLALTGKAAHFAQSDIAAQAVGAAFLDYSRDLHEGETRLGNAAGGALAMYVFGKGNHLTLTDNFWQRQMARTGVGSIGGVAQVTGASLISGQELTGDRLIEAAVSGGAMNVALTPTQNALLKGYEQVTAKGGLPVDRFISRSYGTSKDRSQTLAGLFSDNPWGKVRLGADASRANNALNVVDMTATQPSRQALPDLAHEVAHLEQARTRQSEPLLKAAAEKLTSDREGAWQLYREARLGHESGAQMIEARVRAELGLKAKPVDLSQLHRTIPESLATANETYQQLWRREFETFAHSGGKVTPEVDFMPRRGGGQRTKGTGDNSQWQVQEASAYWHKLSDSSKETHLKRLGAAEPNSYRQTNDQWAIDLWLKGLSDQSPRVQATAQNAVENLPEAYRQSARELLNSPWLDVVKNWGRQDPHAAIARIDQAPDIAAYFAYTQAVGGKDVALKQAAQSRIADLLPAAQSLAWANSFGKQDGAHVPINALPANQRLAAWQQAWAIAAQTAENGHAAKGQLVKEIDGLANRDEQYTAIDIVAAQSYSAHDVTGTLLAMQPENARLAIWAKLMTRRTYGEPHPDMVELSKQIPDGIDTSERWWNLAEKQSFQNSGHAQQDIIGRMSPDDQITAIKTLIRSGGGMTAHTPIHHLSDASLAAHYPEIFAEMLKLPADRLEHHLIELGDYPLQRLPFEMQRTMYPKLFEAWHNLPSKMNIDMPMHWWYKLPETGVPAQSLRDHLFQTLDRPTVEAAVFGEHAASWQSLAESHPDIYRSIIKQAGTTLDKYEVQALGPVVQAWTKTKSSPKEFVDTLLQQKNFGDAEYDFLGVLANTRPRAEREEILTHLGERVGNDAKNKNYSDISRSLEIAEALTLADPELNIGLLHQPIKDVITDRNLTFLERLEIARDIANYGRERGSSLNFELPSLRMPVERVLTPEQQIQARTDVEASLRDPVATRALLGDGLLGRLLPTVFGTDGGIVGRSQGGIHQFALDDHTLAVVEATRNHPEFAHLNPKDQIDQLYAALFHDIGKKPGGMDPDHEWVGSNMIWGVMGTLGYEPQRIARVSNLISRHSDMSYAPHHSPVEALNDQHRGDELSVQYRRPGDPTRLRILNESDIRSLNDTQSYWRDDVAGQLDQATQMLTESTGRLNSVAIPLLTSALPHQFKLVANPGNYAFLGHVSHHLNDGTFIRQRAVIESPEYSMSTSLLRPGHLNYYTADRGDLVALVAGPSEHISQLGRTNLSTGTSVGHNGHVNLATKWVDDSRAQNLVNEINQSLRAPTITRRNAPQIDNLHRLWNEISQFDTLDELRLQHGNEGPLVEAQEKVYGALTHDENGHPLKHHNEVKINNPTLVGLGMTRQGRQVVFQNADEAAIRQLLQGEPKPEWLITDGRQAPADALVVPEQVWRDAQRQNLPFVALD